MDIPEKLETNNPREAVSFGIAVGIQSGVLAKDFKLSEAAWKAIVTYLDHKWDHREHTQLAEMIECFNVGYAVATDQFMPSKRGWR